MEVYKVTLSSKKEVVLRKPLIADIETATTVAGKGVGDNQALLGVRLQKEMTKILLVSVDGKELKMTEKEQLDKLFTIPEFNQVQRVVTKITSPEEGDNKEGNEPTIEFVNSGDK